MHNGNCTRRQLQLLYLLSGRIRVRLGTGEAEVRMGQALVIPRGTWHQIIVDEPGGTRLNVTPGPGAASTCLSGEA